MDLRETIRKNFERIREEKGFTVLGLAKGLGVTPQTIYSYFRKSITIGTITKLANLIGVEEWELLKPLRNDPEKSKGEEEKSAICPHCGGTIKIHINIEK